MTQGSASKTRFGFGKNWQAYSRLIDDERIGMAEMSLKAMLDHESLEGWRFLDIGSGSGLFSLAAARLGATVHSFDYDLDSVACTTNVRDQFLPGCERWTIEKGDALDLDYLNSLGQFDAVYSWGVLHHTGDMWRALQNVTQTVAPGGRLCIAIYNDRGRSSRRWAYIKRTYVKSPLLMKWLMAVAFSIYAESMEALKRMSRVQFPFVFSRLKGSPIGRGMSVWYDRIDWLGGYPFEYAAADRIFSFYRDQGYSLDKLKIYGGHMCNEFVFVRPVEPDLSSKRTNTTISSVTSGVG